jgi:hypothetical protein
MSPDEKMKALFRSETPPTRDFAFEAVIAQKVAARRMWATIIAMIPPTVAVAVGLWGLRPMLVSVAQMIPISSSNALTMTLSTAALAGVAALGVIWSARRFSAR